LDRITDAFAWPFRDPQWVAKIAVMGLIMLIPIAGPITNLGWMLAAIDRLRAGEDRLPPANFDGFGRGVLLFVVLLLYYLALGGIAAIVYVPSVLLFAQEGARDSANPFLVSLAVVLSSIAFGILTLGSLVVTFATPAVILAVDRGGVAAGLRIGDIVRQLRVSPANTVVAGLMLIAASLIAQIGAVACVVGVVFTAAYAFAIQAWIVRSFELGLNAPARPTTA
jgi:hypothetical protein